MNRQERRKFWKRHKKEMEKMGMTWETWKDTQITQRPYVKK